MYILSSTSLESEPMHTVPKQKKNIKFAIYVSMCMCDAS